MKQKANLSQIYGRKKAQRNNITRKSGDKTIKNSTGRADQDKTSQECSRTLNEDFCQTENVTDQN